MSGSDKMKSVHFNDAVDFLTHPDVVGMSNDMKKEFLRSKGLSTKEINDAYQLAERHAKGGNNLGYSMIQKLLMVSGIVYVGYKVFNNAIGWLASSDMRSVDDPVVHNNTECNEAVIDEPVDTSILPSHLEELQSQIATQNSKIEKLERDVEQFRNLQETVRDVKVQVETLKNAFLSRKNFSTPQYLRPSKIGSTSICGEDGVSLEKTSPVTAEKETEDQIPKWQLQSLSDVPPQNPTENTSKEVDAKSEDAKSGDAKSEDAESGDAISAD